MIQKKFLKFVLFFVFVIMLFSVSAYQRSDPKYTKLYSGGGLFGSTSTPIEKLDCDAGQDFIVNIAPFGCTPAPVRTDLLEEQDVPVFCELDITKINPLVDVKAIESITFPGTKPEQVRDIGFQPSRVALGTSSDIITTTNSVLDNIGYAIIVLKQQKNSSAMPDYVEGKVTARLTYNLQNAFGIGKATFYLPEMGDSEWESVKNQYSFWKGAGYLRADAIYDDHAVITINSGSRQIYNFDLKSGAKSQEVYLPGFECTAKLSVTLNDLENPTTRVRLNINGDVIELKDGEKFLDGKCQVKNIWKEGVVQEVQLECMTDEKAKDNFPLSINPKVELEIDHVKGSYNVGDFLYPYMDGVEQKFVYLGYAGTPGDTTSEEGLEVSLVSLPGPMNKDKRLDASELAIVKRIVEGYRWDPNQASGSVGNFISNAFSAAAASVLNAWQNVVKGKNYMEINYGEAENFQGKIIKLNGFSEALNLGMTPEVLDNYQKAMDDYDRVIGSFSEYPYLNNEKVTNAEQALFEKVTLNYNLGQRRKVVEVCDEFKIAYPKSNLTDDLNKYCNNKLKISNSGLIEKDVLINGKIKEITLEGVYEPSFEDYGAVVSVRNDKGEVKDYNLKVNEVVYLNSSTKDFIKLQTIGKDYANVLLNMDKGFFQIVEDSLINANRNIVLDKPENFKSRYEFTLKKINLKKVAKVSINDEIDRVGTEANFTFKIGIEKRGISLSPDEIKSKLVDINKSINDWQDLSTKLGSVVKGLKTACIATQLWFTYTSFRSALSGKGIARQTVMRSEKGWYNKCTLLVQKKEYSSVEKCLTAKSSEIDKDVNGYYEKQKGLSDELKELRKKHETSGGLLGDTVVNDVSYKEDIYKNYASELKSNTKSKLNADANGDVTIQNDVINVDKLVNELDLKTVSVEDLRNMILDSRISGSQSLDEMSNAKLTTEVESIYKTHESEVEKYSFSNAYKEQFSDTTVRAYGVKESITATYDGGVANDSNAFGIPGGSPVQLITFGNTKYVLELEMNVKDQYRIKNIYDEATKTLVTDPAVTKPITDTLTGFKKYSEGDYQNKYLSSSGDSVPVLRYYETDPYKGLPAIVPFDLENGWYASIKQVSSSSSIRSYDDSARVNSFYLCNVGKNGIEENRGSDDICQMINLLTSMPYNNFNGLSSEVAKKKIEYAQRAIEEAKEYSGQEAVYITDPKGKKNLIKVGEPAVEVSDLQCQDVMSPKECQILFNVCDPVICPSSRCDLGGAYPVRDVIQTGISGSLFLCSKNFPEVYIPVCLTGLQAGIDGWISVQKSYRDCLQKNLETGETMGVCDELYSLYTCDMFYKNSVPIGKLVAKKLIEKILGQNVRGGGEYMTTQNAFDGVDKSIKFFTQYYAENSFEAFKSGTTEQAIGGAICKNYVSAVYPSGGNILDSLTEPDSPPQYYGKFDEIPYTTATNPPISQYKVYYHIYAGKESGAYFKVYLSEGPGGSYYQDTSMMKQVAQGYINVGEYASETVDFTSPSGYKQLCIMVNDQLECGFKQVSTEFGVNYIADKYAAQQATTNVTSEEECVSGTPSLYSLLNLNVQEGVSDLTSSEIYNSGIVRFCATNDPGVGTDENAGGENARYRNVGYCDDEKMRCWIDMDSVERVIKDLNIQSEVFNETAQQYQDVLTDEGKVLSNEEFLSELAKINDSIPLKDKIVKIDILLNKAFWSSQKGHLYLFRGQTHGGLAWKDYLSLIVETTPCEKMRKTLDDIRMNKTTLQNVNKTPLQDVTLSILSCEDIEKLYNIVVGGTSKDQKAQGVLIKDIDEKIVDLGLSVLLLRMDLDDEFKFFNTPMGWYYISPGMKEPVEINLLKENPSDLGVSKYFGEFRKFSTKDQESILSLYKKNYLEGLDALMLIADNRETKLSTDYVDYNWEALVEHNGKQIPEEQIFILKAPYNPALWDTVDSLISAQTLGVVGVRQDKLTVRPMDLYLKFNRDHWEWLLNYEGWIPVSKLDDYLNDEVKFPKSLRDLRLDANRLALVRALQDEKDMKNGAKIIFNLNYLYQKAEKDAQTNKAKDEQTQQQTENEKAIEDEYAGKNVCEDCGGSSFDLGIVDKCTREECNEIGVLRDLICDYNPGLIDIAFGGSCVTKTKSYIFVSADVEALREKVQLAIDNKDVNGNSDPILNSRCINYVSEVVAATGEFHIPDPLILMSLMQQESSCNKDISSEKTLSFEDGASYGLMQISGRIWCGNYGLPSDKDNCIKLLLEDPSMNIKLGARILSEGYNVNNYGDRIKAKCKSSSYQKKYLSYTGWEQALRLYNGPGCTPPGADVNFVETVMNRFQKLKDLS